MSIENLLDHKCDIYHINSTNEPGKYGLPSNKEFSFGEVPDIVDCPCHFNLKSGGSENVSQSEPQNLLSHRTGLVLPIGTDVQFNDKIIHKETGLEYTAEHPKNIRGHHIKVMVYRTVIQEDI